MASASELERAGNESYQNEHMAQLFEQGLSFSGFERDCLYRARGDGTYLEISGVSGLDSITDGRGSAFADLDNDGDLDVIAVPVQEVGRLLFRNDIGQDNAFVRVSLKGTRSAKDAFGAVVRLKTPMGTLTKIKAGGSGFLSSGDPRLLFGLGDDPLESYEMGVVWPSGLEESYRIRPGESVLLVEGEGLSRLDDAAAPLPSPLTTSERIFRKLALRAGDVFPKLTLEPVLSATEPAICSEWAQDAREPLGHVVRSLLRRNAGAAEGLPSLRAAGIDLVGISVDTERDKVEAYLEEKGIRYPNYVLASEDFSAIFPGGTLTVPLALLLDERGVPVEAFSGWTTETRARLEALAEP